MASSILNNPHQINIAISKPAEGVRQLAYLTHDNQKNRLISHILSDKDLESVIVFSSTKHKVKSLVLDLKRDGFLCNAIHSDLEQAERETVMRDFRNKKFPVLVATDILSRGIDVDNISLVINYDVPHDAEDYVHRIGRTARANSKGTAITFINEDDQHRFSRIEKLIEREVEKIANPEDIGEGPEYNPFIRHKNRSHGSKDSHRPGGGKSHQRKPQRSGSKPPTNRPAGEHRQPKPVEQTAQTTTQPAAASDAKPAKKRWFKRKPKNEGGKPNQATQSH